MLHIISLTLDQLIFYNIIFSYLEDKTSCKHITVLLSSFIFNMANTSSEDRETLAFIWSHLQADKCPILLSFWQPDLSPRRDALYETERGLCSSSKQRSCLPGTLRLRWNSLRPVVPGGAEDLNAGWLAYKL